jgi:hypothetical protein
MYYRILGLMMVVAFSGALMFPPGAFPQVTIAIGDGSGDPGACATPVEVILENSTVPVEGVSMDICEPGDTLVRLGCDTTTRTPAFSGGSKDFDCVTNELPNGCLRVLLFSGQGHLIEPGSGPIFALKYGVFEEAGPAGSCVTLRAENVLVAGADAPIVNVGLLTGQFCYFECSTDGDCTDALYCNGVEPCVGGACQAGANPCPDDGLFCTGTEGCDETADACTQSGDPCKIGCDETNNVCLCSVDEDCDDGLFCNGVETCNGTSCLAGTNPCPPSSICDEGNDVCVECYNDSDCDDGLFCNGSELCVSGSCQPASSPRCPPLSTCDEANDVCTCTDNAQCDDGLYCNGVERCNSFSQTCDLTFSYFSDYPCKDCTPNLDDCDCNESIDACVPVTLAVGDGSGAPGTTGNTVPVNLDTLFVDVNNVTMDICDTDNYLTCTACAGTGRTPSGFSCLSAEQANGCCRVTLYVLGSSVIEAGTGPVLNVTYSVSAGAPAGACRALTVQNETVATSNVPLDINVTPGQFCFGFTGGSISSAAAGRSLLSASSVAGVAAVSGTGSSQAGVVVSADKAAGQEGSQEALEASADCPIAASVDDQEQLATLRSFRDNVLSKNIFGQIFTFIFYRNAAELTAILKQNDDIRERLKFLVDEYISVIGEAARGETACVGDKDRAVVIDLLKDIKDKGSLQLKADIDLVIEGMVSNSAEEVFGIAVEK